MLDPIFLISIYLDDKEWTHMKHLEQGTRLWHSAVAVNSSTIIIAGENHPIDLKTCIVTIS